MPDDEEVYHATGASCRFLSRVYTRGRGIAVFQDDFPCNFDAIDAVGVMTPRSFVFGGTLLGPCQAFVFPRICTLLYARLASSLYNIRVRPDHI